jgi:hypothetical protein
MLDFFRLGNIGLALLLECRCRHDEDDDQRHTQQDKLEPARIFISTAGVAAFKNSGQ